MISQETKDQIEKEADKYSQHTPYPHHHKIGYKVAATNYAEKLEEKEIERVKEKQRADWFESEFNRMVANKKHEDARLEEKNKEIEKLTEDSRLWKIAHDNCANHFDDLKKQLESKNLELSKCKKSHELLESSLASLNEELIFKDHKLLQLKELAEKMAVRLEHYVNEEDELLTKYAKWTSTYNV